MLALRAKPEEMATAAATALEMATATDSETERAEPEEKAPSSKG